VAKPTTLATLVILADIFSGGSSAQDVELSKFGIAAAIAEDETQSML
jgi:hypothetical protein